MRNAEKIDRKKCMLNKFIGTQPLKPIFHHSNVPSFHLQTIQNAVKETTYLQ